MHCLKLLKYQQKGTYVENIFVITNLILNLQRIRKESVQYYKWLNILSFKTDNTDFIIFFKLQTTQHSQSNITSLTEVPPSSFHKLGENVLLSSAATGSWIDHNSWRYVMLDFL